MEENITRRERKKIHSKKSIVESAIKLFSQKGYQETSVADIMNEADLGIGTFYNYFHSKEDIIHHVLTQKLDQAENSLEKLNKSTIPSQEKISRI